MAVFRRVEIPTHILGRWKAWLRFFVKNDQLEYSKKKARKYSKDKEKCGR